MFDNTGDLLGSIEVSGGYYLNATARGAVAWRFPEVDPVCGPGSYVLTALWLPLSGLVESQTATISVALYTFDMELQRPGSLVSVAGCFPRACVRRITPIADRFNYFAGCGSSYNAAINTAHSGYNCRHTSQSIFCAVLLD